MTRSASTVAARDPVEANLDAATTLRARIEARQATVAVIGLGYVGLPLVNVIHGAGFPVLGFDVDPGKIEQLRKGETYLAHLGTDTAKALADSDRFEATTDPGRLSGADIIILCVPTPLGPHREPDLHYVLDSTRKVAATLRPGQLVVLESTTYPGTTRHEMMPILEAKGLHCGEGFFLAYSPEREDPGRANTTTASIPKLVGGVDDASTGIAVAFYEAFVENVHRVDSAEVAEAAKLLENIYRAVNIAMVNELKLILDRMDIDVWKVVEAAATKPFGFQAFYPGPGLGGHCIPIDPFYLTWKAKELGYATRFIELAGEINARMPAHVVSRVAEALNDDGQSLRGARVLVLGIAYKPNIDDVRESPAAPIIESMVEQGAEVAYHDPHVATFPDMRHHDIDLASVPLDEERLRRQDCVLIVTDHAAIDWAMVGLHARLIVDTRNAMAREPDAAARIVKA